MTATDITAALDEEHRLCLVMRDHIRREVADAIDRVRRWTPAPYPTEREER